MTVLHPDMITVEPLPVDPSVRYQHISLFSGLWVILITGDHAVEGRLIHAIRPDLTSDNPSPLITLDTVEGPLTGPALAGDMLAAPSR